MVVICFYTTITQDTSIYQNIWVTQNFNRDVIISSAYNMFYHWAKVARIISFLPSNTVGITSVLLK